MDPQVQALAIALTPFYPLLAAANQAHPANGATAAGNDDIKNMLLDVKNEQAKIMERLDRIEAASAERVAGTDIVADCVQNMEAVTQALAGQLKKIERKVEKQAEVMGESVKAIDVAVGSSAKRINDALAKNAEHLQAGVSKQLADLDKNVADKLEKVLTDTGGLSGKLLGIDADIKAAVSSIAKLSSSSSKTHTVVEGIKAQTTALGMKKIRLETFRREWVGGGTDFYNYKRVEGEYLQEE
ncbi:hypothetical protein TeGR_g11051 [Tetraparma gracilis]|uniref:Uncharacterized protein n=1 Tax=Tetraparma gracilis TaxID=2962635 RepID=A0ABQ6MNQ3_9STRA|nr:hypothetical protein TeGR_g11051 [Tetraparma gracilis]